MNCQDLSGRLARWSLKLQGFTFNIEHRKGTQNVVPDTLSRVYAADELDINDLNNVLFVDLDSAEFQDKEYVDRINVVKDNPSANTNLKVLDGKLFITQSFGINQKYSDITEWKLFIPARLTAQLIFRAHNPPTSSHLGTYKTLELLQRKYYWPNMASDVKNYVSKCEICKSVKAPNYSTQPEMGKQRVSERPWQNIFIDFLGPYPLSKSGNMYLFIVVDQYSRFVLLEPMRLATSERVVQFLENRVFALYSVPQTLQSDNGKQFISKIFQDLMKKYGIRHIFSPKYSPQPNISERVNRTLLSAIRAYIDEDQTIWDENIHQVASALRNVVHSSTKFSPHYLVFGQHKINHASDYELLKM